MENFNLVNIIGKRLSFEVSDDLPPQKAGVYSGNIYFNQKNRKNNDEFIRLNSKFVESASQIEIEKVLCHEFIHFLVMNNLILLDSDSELFLSEFLNEGYTEMLTQEIYPGVLPTYTPQTAIIDLAHTLTNTKKDFSLFLSRKIPFKNKSITSEEYNKFINDITLYHLDYAKQLENADPSNLLSAIRHLINYSIESRMSVPQNELLTNYIDLYKIIKIYQTPPEHSSEELSKSINKELSEYLGKLDKTFLQKLHGDNHTNFDGASIALSKIVELLNNEKNNTQTPNIFTENIDGLEYRFEINNDKTCNVYCLDELIESNLTDYETVTNTVKNINIVFFPKLFGRILITSNSGTKTVDVSQKAIKKRESEINRKKSETKKASELLYNKNFVEDTSILFSKKYDYTKVERVTLPSLGPDEEPPFVYVLYLKDGNSIILDSNGNEIPVTKDIQNQTTSKLTGLAGNPTNYSYYYTNVDQEDNMYVAKIDKNTSIGISIGEKNEIKITRVSGSTAFVSETELLFGNNSGLYNSLISGKAKTVESSEGNNTNVQNYVDKQELLSLVEGLDPEKVKEARKLIEEMIKKDPTHADS